MNALDYFRTAIAVSRSWPTAEQYQSPQEFHSACGQWEHTANRLADTFEEHDRSFDRDEFLKNCGVD